MNTSGIPLGFLTISLVSLAVQVVSFSQIVSGTGATPAYRGLLRTSVCRVVVTVAYVAFGVTALLMPPEVIGVTALVLFGLVQGVWIANSLLDVRLRQVLPRSPAGRHQRLKSSDES